MSSRPPGAVFDGHIRHWEHGGPTDLGNLVLVCHFHHKLVHEYRWRVVLKGRDVTWYRPSGEIFVFGPEPPPEHYIQAGTSKPKRELLPAIF